MNNTITISNIREYIQRIINGNLVLTLTIDNIQEYYQRVINGNLVLTRIVPLTMNNNTITISNIREYIQQVINSNLVLTITISNIQEYIQQVINDNLVLTIIVPIVPLPLPLTIVPLPLTIVPLTIIDELTILHTDLTYSRINVCKINNQIINIQKYRKLLLHLYYKTDRSTILRMPKSNLKIKPGDFRENNFCVNDGYIYDKKLDLSIQRGDSSKILTEIINIIRKNNYNMELTIDKYKAGEIINFRM